jgi:hypothetical protein
VRKAVPATAKPPVKIVADSASEDETVASDNTEEDSDDSDNTSGDDDDVVDVNDFIAEVCKLSPQNLYVTLTYFYTRCLESFLRVSRRPQRPPRPPRSPRTLTSVPYVPEMCCKWGFLNYFATRSSGYLNEVPPHPQAGGSPSVIRFRLGGCERPIFLCANFSYIYSSVGPPRRRNPPES